MREAGGRSLAITAVRSQRNGEFWGLGRAMELEDGTWRDAQGVSDRAIYKGDYGGLQKTASPQVLADLLWLDKKTRETEDFSDVWNLTQAVDAPITAAQRGWLYENVNVPELVNYLAVNAVIRHQDSNFKNWFVTRDTEGTGRWEMWHWDLNWIFTTPAEDGHGEYLLPVTSNRFLTALTNQPEFKAMFFRRVRTLADQFLAPGRYEAQWEAIAGPSVGDWALETARWGGRSSSAARAKFDQGLADRRAVIVNNTGLGKPVPSSQSAAPDVVISEIQYAPVSGDNAEFVELTNPSLSESVDVSGWTVEGIGLTIAPGTVLLPGAQVVVVKNDVAFRSTYGSDQRLVAGEYPTTLPDTGATLRLRQGSRVVDEVSYEAIAPWPTAAAGTGPSLELADPFLDNALPGNWTATSAAGGTPGRANTVVLPPDGTAPSIPTGLAAGNVTSSSVSLTWSPSTDNRGVAGYRLVRNGVELPEAIASTSITDTGLSPGTTYSYAVRAFDAAGNVSSQSAVLPVTTAAPDPVLFSDLFTGADGSPWASSWVTGSGAGGSVSVVAGTGQLAVSSSTSSFGRASLSGLGARAGSETVFSYRFSDAAAVAYFSVWSRGSGGWQNAYRPANGYGLEFASNSSTVALKRNVSGTVSTLASVAGARVVGTGRQWVRLRVSGSTVSFRTWVDGAVEPSTWARSVTDTSVTAPGQLFVSLVRGGTTTTAKNVTLDDLRIIDPAVAAPDLPPTAPTGLTASAVTSTSATISWSPSTDDRGVAGYRVVRDGVLLPGTVAGTTFVDSGLTPATTYSYRVRAVDTGGNVSTDSAELPVSTSATPDLPPSAPTGLAASAVTSTSATISWSASTDDRGIAGYRVVRDGVLLPGTVASTAFVDTGLTPATTYSYRVRAVDTGGNVSTDSVALPVTTAAPDPVLFSDLFTGADGSPWASSWVTGSGAGGSVSVVAGTGQLAVSSSTSSFGRASLSGLGARAGSETVFSYRFSDAAAVAYFSVWSRGSGGWQNAYRPANGYGLEFASNSSTVALKRNVSGTVSTLASVAGARVVGTGRQWVRLRVSGSTVSFRTWVDGAVEPSTWARSVTDTSVTAPGQLFVSLVRGGTTTTAKNVTLDDLRVLSAP